MARFQGPAVVAESVAALFSEARLGGEFTGAEYPVLGSATITGNGSPNPTKTPELGVSVFPYRLSYNLQRRPVTPRVTPSGERFRPSLFVDLHLLISAWGNRGTQQMVLLAWAARMLEDTPTLGPGFLNRWADGGEVVFGPNESVEIVAEPLTQQDLVAIWEINKQNLMPSLGYVARMIAIDSDLRLPDADLVRSRNFDHGVLAQ